MNENSSEIILQLLIDLYKKNNEEISMIECLAMLIAELEIDEHEISLIIDDNIKSILKDNSFKHRLFRKEFYKPNFKSMEMFYV
jgi:hypothetical protein